MSNMFMGPNNNLPKKVQTQQQTKVSPFKGAQVDINKGINSLFGPITTFFDKNPEAISQDKGDVGSEVIKKRAEAMELEKMLKGSGNNTINFMG